MKLNSEVYINLKKTDTHTEMTKKSPINNHKHVIIRTFSKTRYFGGYVKYLCPYLTTQSYIPSNWWMFQCQTNCQEAIPLGVAIATSFSNETKCWGQKKKRSEQSELYMFTL